MSYEGGAIAGGAQQAVPSGSVCAGSVSSSALSGAHAGDMSRRLRNLHHVGGASVGGTQTDRLRTLVRFDAAV